MTARPYSIVLVEQPRRGELMQRIVDGRQRHRHFRAGRFLIKHFCSDMPVAFGEKDPTERHALAGRPQPDLPQHCLHVMPGTAVEGPTLLRRDPEGGAGGCERRTRGCQGHDRMLPDATIVASVTCAGEDATVSQQAYGNSNVGRQEPGCEGGGFDTLRLLC